MKRTINCLLIIASLVFLTCSVGNAQQLYVGANYIRMITKMLTK